MSKKTSIVLFAIAFTTLLIILGVTIYELRPVFNSLINDPKHLDQAIDQYMENIGIYRAIILVILQIALDTATPLLPFIAPTKESSCHSYATIF